MSTQLFTEYFTYNKEYLAEILSSPCVSFSFSGISGNSLRKFLSCFLKLCKENSRVSKISVVISKESWSGVFSENNASAVFFSLLSQLCIDRSSFGFQKIDFKPAGRDFDQNTLAYHHFHNWFVYLVKYKQCTSWPWHDVVTSSLGFLIISSIFVCFGFYKHLRGISVS